MLRSARHAHGAFTWTALGRRSLHEAVSVRRNIAGRELTLETGLVGPLADSVIRARYGDTSILTSVVSSHHLLPEDQMPLMVEYREKSYAAGMIPPTFTRRESMCVVYCVLYTAGMNKLFVFPRIGRQTGSLFACRPQDREILGSRLIDRTVRPLFPKGYVYETQIISSLTSFQEDSSPDALSVLGASAGLLCAGLPWCGPAAAVRVGWVDGRPVINPTAEEQAASRLLLLYAGTANRALMIEVGASELWEDDLVTAFRAGQEALEPLLEMQTELQQLAGKPLRDATMGDPPKEVIEAARELISEDAKFVFMNHALVKAERSRRQAALRKRVETELQEVFPDVPLFRIGAAAEIVFADAYRQSVLETSRYIPGPRVSMAEAQPRESAEKDASAATPPGADCRSSMEDPFAAARSHGFAPFEAMPTRPDGRRGTEIRPLQGEISILPVVHGSSLFSRGDTQTMCTTTLGPPQIAQLLRPVSDAPAEKGFFLHYEFPPYSVNETGTVGGVNRRMIGHGSLAEKAVAAVMPSSDEFPYTVRVTSEVTGSDGSSSMATVCGATLALMDAGVPIRRPVAGISMGLITDEAFADPSRDHSWETAGSSDGGEQRRFTILTDILGMEDHIGDMDFKVAGSRDGVTALQMDIKLPGIPLSILEAALWRARKARLEVLDMMEGVISSARPDLKESAPRMELVVIPLTKRGMVIGPGGMNLKRIQKETGAELKLLDDSDYLQIYAPSEDGILLAKQMIAEALSGRTFLPESARPGGEEASSADAGPRVARPLASALRVGDTVRAEVVEVREFGAVMKSEGGSMGWLHISEIDVPHSERPAGKSHPRPDSMEDVVSLGDSLEVLVTDVDGLGRGRFSRREIQQQERVAEAKKRKQDSLPPAQDRRPTSDQSDVRASEPSSPPSSGRKETTGGRTSRGPPRPPPVPELESGTLARACQVAVDPMWRHSAILASTGTAAGLLGDVNRSLVHASDPLDFDGHSFQFEPLSFAYLNSDPFADASSDAPARHPPRPEHKRWKGNRSQGGPRRSHQHQHQQHQQHQQRRVRQNQG